MENIQLSKNMFSEIGEKTNALQNSNNQSIIQDENKNFSNIPNIANATTPGSNDLIKQNETSIQSQVFNNGLGKLDIKKNEPNNSSTINSILEKPKFGLGNIFNYKVIGGIDIL